MKEGIYMVKRKGSLIVTLLAAMVVCATAGALPANAMHRFGTQSTDIDTNQAGGTYWETGSVSLDETHKQNVVANVKNNRYDSEEQARKHCEDVGVDYDSIIKSMHAYDDIDYPTMNYSWQKNKAGQWFYSADARTWCRNGWEQIGGKFYYFYDSGVLAVNTTTPDGYKVDANGVWVS